MSRGVPRGLTTGCSTIRRVVVFLETARLVLRQFTEDDVDVLVQLDGDPDVMHFSYVFFQSSCCRPSAVREAL